MSRFRSSPAPVLPEGRPRRAETGAGHPLDPDIFAAHGVLHRLHALGLIFAEQDLLLDPCGLADHGLLTGLPHLDDLFGEGSVGHRPAILDRPTIDRDRFGARRYLLLDRRLDDLAADPRGAAVDPTLA